MPLTIQLVDEFVPGGKPRIHSLDCTAPPTTLRELLMRRVREEVEHYNASLPEVYQGLVQPEESEIILNGFRLKTKRPLDWEMQYRRACSSFSCNGFLVLVNGEQVTDLDEELDLSPRQGASSPEIEFIKLVPLVGG